ncbi:acyl-CoA dehydrogenase family protein [Sphingomonas sp. SRS2]|uniref:acyl-CoA dehydrogenase family protein n=1 Tax=Sphingomonas sp. SRS2 TaxID=133190 RepID=UPI001364B141|nr:acyl-CoA dehydrogenase family protein [Sphingomonas sp. SRS2]
MNTDQQAMLDAVGILIQRARARARDAGGAVIEDELQAAGFLDIVDATGSYLDAALIVEAVAREPVALPIAWRAMLAPFLGLGSMRVAPWRAGHEEPTRFGEDVEALLVIDEPNDRLALVQRADCGVRHAGSGWGYPMAWLVPRGAGRAIARSAGGALALWRLGLALELVGCAGGAFAQTVTYVREREQFGKPIGSHQAIKHRLAQLAVDLEGARYLAFQAAYHAPDAELAASAATRATLVGAMVFREAHQMHGAIGYTREFALSGWTTRLRALGKELGGTSAHAIAVTRARFSGAAERGVIQ